MRILFYPLIFFIGLFGVIACVNPRIGGNGDATKVGKPTEGKIVGIYKGDLPCTDCEAIATVLTLTKERSYTLEYVYVGKSIEAFSKSGTWKLKNEELILSDVDYTYKVENKQLRQLDLSANEITGELAERYLLKLLQ